MRLIDDSKCVLPEICLATDDPYRVKMIAAHHLDNVEIFTETRGQVGLIGKFENIDLTVMSVGIGITSTLAYLNELCSENSIKRIVYLGDCVTEDASLPIGSIVYINKAYEKDKCFLPSEQLYKQAEIVARKNDIKAFSCAATTDDGYLIGKKYNVLHESRILDFTTSAIYGISKAYANIEVLSILNVSKNIITNEKVNEAVRQSGYHSAVMFVLHTLISK